MPANCWPPNPSCTGASGSRPGATSAKSHGRSAVGVIPAPTQPAPRHSGQSGPASARSWPWSAWRRTRPRRRRHARGHCRTVPRRPSSPRQTDRALAPCSHGTGTDGSRRAATAGDGWIGRGACIAAREVGARRAVVGREQRVAGEHDIANDIGHVRRGMARHVRRYGRNTPDREPVAVIEQPVELRVIARELGPDVRINVNYSF